VPFIGNFLEAVLRGGSGLSAATLARFFSVHIWFLPAIIIALIGVHLYLVVKLGISSVPKDEK
jgi:quinol-cytochrome oxidoreductase complex cytochrome b subunit